jgi:hypothetical protein
MSAADVFREEDQAGLTPEFAGDRGRPSGVLSPNRYSLTLGMPVQHYIEAICEIASTARLGYIVTLIGESQRILPHAVTQRFGVAPDGMLVPPTEGSTKPVSVINGAGLARVEQFELRVT